ncbi:Ig-like domain-containing protein [[Pasteurella] aerogenes]|nr:Ig-like domain-containing protein [[Pasteurella] aerogenes]
MTTTVKVLNAKKEVANYTASKGQPLVIQAQDKVNYQLIDDATGLAPQNIIAKRENNNLVITLEDGDTNPDIIIENYYNDNGESTNLIIGQHENGNLYVYVPESGVSSEAISILAEEVIAPQALGGDVLKSAFWAFNPWWLLGAAALIGGIAAIASGGGGGGGGSSTPAKDTTAPNKPSVVANDDGSVTVTPATDATKTSVTYTDENGNTKTVEFTKGNDGKWVDNNPNDGITVDPNTGVVTIPEDAIKGGSEVTATNTDEAGNPSDPATVTSVDTDAPVSPTITPNTDGSVTVTPADDATETTITYVDENGDEQTVTFTKEDTDGDGVPDTWVDNNPNDTVAVNPDTGVVTIPEDAIKGGSEVTATNTDEAGNPSDPATVTSVDTDAPVSPTITPNTDGSVTVTPADDATETTITYVDENGDEQTVTFTKEDTDGDGVPDTWVDNNPNDTVAVNPDTGVVTIPEDAIKGGSEVTATNTDEAGNPSDPATATSEDTDAPVSPTITPNTDGSVTVTPADDATETTITYVDENGDEQTVTFTKEDTDGDGVPDTWVDNNPNDTVAVNPDTGVVTIPEDAIKGGSEVTATNTDEAGNPSDPATATSEDTDAPVSPTITPNTDGSVTVTPADDATETTITYVDENGDEQTVTFTKEDTDGDGVPDTWVDNNPNDTVAVNPDTGVVTIPEDAIKGGSEVTATNTDEAGNPSDPATATSEDTDAPVSPTITPNTDGSVTVTPADDATETTITYVDENGDEQTVTFTKEDTDGDGVPDTWVDNNPNDTVAVNPDTGVVTIPEDAIKGGSEVTATNTDEAGNPSDPATATSEDTDAPVSPTITPNTDGSVTVTPADDATETTITYVDENGDEQTVTFTKEDTDGDGVPDTWVDNNPNDTVAVNPDTGVVTIPEDAIKGGSEVTATNTDEAGNPSDPATATSEDTDAPVSPTITPNTDGSVTVTPADDATETTITYVDENGDEQTVTFTKEDTDGDGVPDTWVDNNPNDTVAVNPDTGVVTIPEDAIKGGSEVTATNTDEAGNPSDSATVTSVDTDAPVSPTITPNTDGSVTVTPADDATETTITYVDENGDEQTVTFTKEDTDGDGVPDTWVDNNPNDTVAVNPDTGVVTIPEDAIKGGSEVTATNTDEAGNPSDPATVTSVDTDAPVSPTITPNTDGSVTVTPADDATETTITYVDENGDEQTVTFTKEDTDGDGVPDTWVDNNPNDTVAVNPDTGVVTIPEDAIKGGSEVTATNTDEAGNPSDPATATSEDTDAPVSPTITPNTDGSVTVTPADDATETTITYVDENGDEQTVTFTKEDTDGDGVPDTWVDNNPNDTVAVNPDTGVVTIPEDAIKGGSEVTATNTDEAGNPSDPAKATAIDTDAPNAPTSITVTDDVPATTGTITDGKITNDDKPTFSGTDANPGDTITVTLTDKDGNTITVTTTVKDDGTWTVDTSDLPDGTYTSKITATDTAGNTSEATTGPSFTVDTTAPDATTTQIAVNPIATDDIINATEAGQTTLPVSGTVTGEFKEGDKVTVTVNGKDYTTTVAADGTFSVDVNTADLVADPDTVADVKVSATDEAGNVGEVSTTKDYTVDTTAPNADTTTITVDPIATDDIINATEAGQTTLPVSGTVTGEFKEGDKVTVTVNGKDYTTTVAADGTFSVDVNTADLVADPDTVADVKVSATDEAGNVGEVSTTKDYTVDTTAPNADTTTITVDPIATDDIINATEAGQTTLPVSGTVTGEFKEGDKVTVTVNGKDYTTTVAADGTFSVDVNTADLVADPDTVADVKVSATDEAGNVGEVSTTKDYTVDTTAPNADTTTITVDPIATDDIINATEAGQTTLPVSGTVTGEFKEGDKVTVTVNGKDYTTTVAADGTFSVDVNTADLVADPDTVADVKVSATDEAGNVGEVSTTKDYTVDTTAPNADTTTITVDPIATDDIINATEAGQTTLPVSGTVTGEFKEGDKVTVTVNGKDYTTTVAADGTFSVDVNTADLVADPDTVADVKVSATDEAGNVGEVSTTKDYTVDTTAPNADTTTITVDPIATDDIINATEAGQTTLPVSGTVTGEFKEGDKVTVTVNGKDYTTTVAADGTFSVDVNTADLVADPDTVADVKVSATDEAGNVGEVSTTKDYTVDTTAPNADTTTITVDPIATDDIINATEAGQTTLPVSGTVTGEFKEGDKVTVTVNGKDYTTTVAADGTFSVDVNTADLVADPDTVADVKVSATDEAGNVGEVSTTKDYTVDTTAPNADTTTITVDPIATDDIINATEAGQTTLPVSGTVTGEFKEGDKVTVTVNGKDYTTTVAADGTFSVDVNTADLVADPDTVADVKVSATDEAGNVGEVSTTKDYTVDTTAPNADTTTITVDPIATDDIINATEAGQTTLPVSGTVTGEFKEGDKVTVTVNGKDYTTTVAADGTFSVDVNTADLVADPDTVADVKVSATDEAGNVGEVSTTKDYTVDTTAPNADTTTITVDPIATDDIINATEAGQTTLPVSGTVTGEFKEGDKVTVTVNGKDYTTTVAADGTFSVDVNTADLVADPDTVADVKVAATDAAGNVGEVLTTKDYSVDTTAGENNTITITAISTDSGTSSTDFITNDTTLTVSGELGVVLAADEKVQISLDGGTTWIDAVTTGTTWTADATSTTLPAGETTILARIVDTVGNVGPTDDQVVTIDTTEPSALVTAVTIMMDNNPDDGIIDAAEKGTATTTDVKVDFSTDAAANTAAKEGDIIELTVTRDGVTTTVEHTLTAAEAAAGTYTFTGIALPAEDGTLTVAASISKDIAGNVNDLVAEKSDSAVLDAVADPTININSIAGDAEVTEGTDGYATITVAEAAAGFTISGVTENVEAGQTVTVTITGDSSTAPVTATATVGADGKWTANVPANELTVTAGQAYTVVAKVSNVAGTAATDTDITAAIPKVSISVTSTDIDPTTGEGATNTYVDSTGTEVTIPATIEDTSVDTGLVYTVALTSAATEDVTVVVTLTGTAVVADYNAVTANQHVGSVALTTGSDGAAVYDSTANTVTVTIPAGKTEVSFTVDPTMEANEAAYNLEGVESVIATITSATGAVAETETVNNAGASATGAIYEGNPISAAFLAADVTLRYGGEFDTRTKGVGNEVITDYNGTVDILGGTPVLTSNFGDTLYFGYYPNTDNTGSLGNFGGSLTGEDAYVNTSTGSAGAKGKATDGAYDVVTVDTAAGDDYMRVRGDQLGRSRLYMGEGSDTYQLDGQNFITTYVMTSNSYVFTESGDDKVLIGTVAESNSELVNGKIYLGSGSDTLTIGTATNSNNMGVTGTIDLGSGTATDATNMPAEYLATYQDGTGLSLGNDDNIDATTDVNTVQIYGYFNGATVTGGNGIDNITLTEGIIGGTTINLGANDDSLTAGDIIRNSTINMGDGNDTVDFTAATFGQAAYTTSLNTGAGEDVIKLGTLTNSSTGSHSVDAGADNDTVVLTQDYTREALGMTTYIQGGEGTDTLAITGSGTDVRISSGTYLGVKEGIVGFENFDMTVNSGLTAETTAQTVSLTAADVLNLGVTDNTIYISGDANDKVDLGANGSLNIGSFTKTLTTTTQTALDGTEHTYTLYTHTNGAQVYVDDKVEVI